MIFRLMKYNNRLKEKLHLLKIQNKKTMMIQIFNKNKILNL